MPPHPEVAFRIGVDDGLVVAANGIVQCKMQYCLNRNICSIDDCRSERCICKINCLRLLLFESAVSSEPTVRGARFRKKFWRASDASVVAACHRVAFAAKLCPLVLRCGFGNWGGAGARHRESPRSVYTRSVYTLLSLRATHVTADWCPWYSRTTSPVRKFHSRATRSLLAVTR